MPLRCHSLYQYNLAGSAGILHKETHHPHVLPASGSYPPQPINSPTTSHFSLASACFLPVVLALPHHTMDNFEYTDPYFDLYTDPDFDDALWSKLYEDMSNPGHSYDFTLQSIHTANDDLQVQDSNAPHDNDDTASIPVPTTLTETFTQTNDTYLVSKQPLDRRH